MWCMLKTSFCKNSGLLRVSKFIFNSCRNEPDFPLQTVWRMMNCILQVLSRVIWVVQSFKQLCQFKIKLPQLVLRCMLEHLINQSLQCVESPILTLLWHLELIFLKKSEHLEPQWTIVASLDIFAGNHSSFNITFSFFKLRRF